MPFTTSSITKSNNLKTFFSKTSRISQPCKYNIKAFLFWLNCSKGALFCCSNFEHVFQRCIETWKKKRKIIYIFRFDMIFFLTLFLPVFDIVLVTCVCVCVLACTILCVIFHIYLELHCSLILSQQVLFPFVYDFIARLREDSSFSCNTVLSTCIFSLLGSFWAWFPAYVCQVKLLIRSAFLFLVSVPASSVSQSVAYKLYKAFVFV